jgi:DNA-binding PadR family transcriptional regulator
MSPVFRHGRLRLYLLKLLDESPRHGYEVIRLLQDRFLGVYAPSPGTIYPRLARLEEDGLVTHEEVDGKKVYSITDKGREEIRNRLSDLADLEDELTESLRDVAREISEDVRETVRGIREELTAAAREFRGQPGPRTAVDADAGESGASKSGAGKSGAADADEARRIREEARRTREEMRAKFRERSRSRSRGAAADWQERFGRADWASFASGPDRSAGGSGGSSPRAGTEWSSAAGEDSGPRPGRGGGNPFSDLERMAVSFANELRSAAKQAGTMGERSLGDLRDILTDTLAKVRLEVFPEDKADGQQASQADTGDSQPDDKS